MKLIKKIAAIMFAFMMVVSMSCNVKAEEGASPETTGTLTINGVKEKQTYKLYKVLDLESFSGDNYSYKVAQGWEDFFSTGKGNNYITINENNYANWTANKDDATYRVFAQEALEYANSKTLKPTKTYTTKADQTSITETGLALGYYLLDSSVGTLCSLSSSQPDVTINEKNDVPTVEKTITDGGVRATDNKSNSVNIGDTVTFQTIINVKKGAQGYVLHDTLSNGLKLISKVNNLTDSPIMAVAHGTDESGKEFHNNLIKNSEYTITYDDNNFTVTILDSYLKNHETVDYDIAISYKATLTDAAVIGAEGNKNETYLTYGVDSESTHSTTTTYTFGIPVFKYTGTNTPLAGAEFKLYTDSNCNDESTALKFSLNNNNKYRYDSTKGKTVLTSLETTGHIDIEGLKEGTYYLKETKAPKGYNLLKAPVEIRIDSAGKIYVDDSTKENTGNVEVKNNSGTLLPSTGGAGTTMIYLVGALLVLGSGVVLASKRRSNSK